MNGLALKDFKRDERRRLNVAKRDGWPAMQGDPIDRDRAFRRAVLREWAKLAGLRR